jgi:predicted nuclease of predicted toxin-antitoxin system
MGEWRFLVDENLEPQIAHELETRGFEAESIRDTIGKGVDDPTVLEYARRNDAIILTSDVNDFGPLDNEQHRGLLLLYSDETSAHRVATAVADLVAAFGDRKRLRAQYPLDDWL